MSEIYLKQKLAVGLKGLDELTHIIVVFYMHQAEFTPERDLVRRPRGRADMPEIGVFASRTKQRPNPIGVSTAKLIKVEGSLLTVKGLDAIDGTPVLDLKPYFPIFDRIEDAAVPEWVNKLLRNYY